MLHNIYIHRIYIVYDNELLQTMHAQFFIFHFLFYKVYALGMLLDEWYGGHYYKISFYRLRNSLSTCRGTKCNYRVCTVQ
jgi:hypothetical protein